MKLTRARIVLLTVLVAGAIIITATMTWVHASMTSGTVLPIEVSVNGSDGVRAVPALGLVALAAGVATSIAGRIARVVVGVVISLAAIGIGVSAATVLANPAIAADAQIAERSGITGGQIEASTTAAPAICLALAVLLLLCGLAILILGRRWNTTKPSKKYEVQKSTDVESTSETASTDADVDTIDSWDQLTHGKDPTS